MAYTVRCSFLNVGQGLASVVEIYDGVANALPAPPLFPVPVPLTWPPLPPAPGGALVLVNPLPMGVTLESIWIIDFGSTSTIFGASSVAVRYVQELMLLQGRNVIDVVSISHLDKDHYSLLPYLGAGTTITSLYIGGEDAARNNINTLIAELTSGGITVTNLVTFFGGHVGTPGNEYKNPMKEVKLANGKSIGFYVLISSAQHIYTPTPASAADFINTGSTMLLVFGGGVDRTVNPPAFLGADFSFLMTGDATRKTLSKFLAQGFGFTGEPKGISVAHHGSDTSINSRLKSALDYTDLVNFLTLYTPNVGVVSAGNNHAYKHPGKYSMAYVREAVRTKNAGLPFAPPPIPVLPLPDPVPPPAVSNHTNSIYYRTGEVTRVAGVGLAPVPANGFYEGEEIENLYSTSRAPFVLTIPVRGWRRNIHCDYNSANPGVYTIHLNEF